VSRPYNNPFSRHVRRVAALARLKGPDPTPPSCEYIVGANAEQRKAKVLADHADHLVRATARYMKEKTALEERVAKGPRR
jgi:hypothetical protein